MTTDRSRRGPRSVAPVLLLVVLASLLLAGSGAARSFGNQLPSVHVAAAGSGQGGLAWLLPRSQQPDRAGWNDVPGAVLAAGLVFAAGAGPLARRRRPRAATLSFFAPSSPRAPPARVSTS